MNKKLKSLLGYRRDSPFKDEPYLVIESNNITMDNVDKDLILLPNKGKPVIAKANSGGYLFPNASRVKEIPLKEYQAGGVSMKPVSPFMDLKMFKNRYKLEQLPTYQMGGILDDYIKTLPEEQQNLFMGEFQSLEPDVQQEVLFMLGGKYQMGGQTPLQEVEGDETAVLPDSELVEFKGKKHKDGGIKVDLPNGTRIYSEYSTAPAEIVEQVLGKKTKGKMSYADLSKKFPTKPYMEILSDEKSDEYEKNGAQLKLMNNLSKLDTIFYAQEAEKKQEVKGKFQKGGINRSSNAQEAAWAAPDYLHGLESGYEGRGVKQAIGHFKLSSISDRFESTGVDNVFLDRENKSVFLRRSDGTYDYVGDQDEVDLSGKLNKENSNKQSINLNKSIRQEVQPLVPPTPLTYYVPPVKGVGQVDWTTGKMYQPDTVQYPTIHQEPYPTVSTGVRLNLMEPQLNLTYDLNPPQVDIVAQRNQPLQPAAQVRGKQSNKRTKPVLDLTNNDSSLLEIPLPFGQLPTADLKNRQVTSMGVQAPETAPTLNQEGTDSQDSTSYESQDDKDFPLRSKENRFGISSKLAGTIADIGLALSDKLRVSEPTLYDRRKYPLFTRFVDFDDKEVQRMYDKGIQQIQNSNVPEAQKQAQITELLSKYQDYQGKVDYNNLQRYEGKREQDTNKLQQYLDQNVDIKVADTQDYKERKSRVEDLKNQFLAQRKSRVINSLKAYANYADTISRANELYTDNYLINPITGKISYRPTEQSKLPDTQSLVAQYRQNANNKVSLPNGATLTMLNESTGIVTDSNGKTEIVKLK